MPREIKYDTNLQVLMSSDDKDWFTQYCDNNDTTASKQVRRFIHQLRLKEEKRKARI